MAAAEPRSPAPAPPDRGTRTRELAELALAIIDADGIAGLTMRRLAAEAGISPMALYWYFDNKQAVLGAALRVVDGEMTDGAPGPGEDDPQSAVDWLRELMSRCVGVLTRHHPDITALLQTASSGASPELYSEHALGNFELSLGKLAALGITGVAAIQISHLFGQTVFMLALACRRDPDSGRSPDDRLRAQWEALGDVAPDRYPHIREAASAYTSTPEAETLLERGIEMMIAALEGIGGRARQRTVADRIGG